MKKVWELYEQLLDILKNNSDIKSYQEINILHNKLSDYIDLFGERNLGDLKDSVAFLHNADLANPNSFGKCGDDVYWKVVDEVLYIGGKGPMWNFDNSTLEFKSDYTYSPWIKANFLTVVIHDGVTTIGSDAFHGAEISSVIIPSSIKAIGKLAFFDSRIEKLILPSTIEIIEEGILSGFHQVVDTLVVSADIREIKSNAFFNRDDALANCVFLTGNLPDDLTKLIESCIFDGVESYKIYYPKEWDTDDMSFYDRLSNEFSDSDDEFKENIKNALISYII